MSRILMIVYTYVPDDPRVIAEAQTAVKLGYHVDAIGTVFAKGLYGKSTLGGVNITIVPIINKLGQIIPSFGQIAQGRVSRGNISSESPSESNMLSILFFYLWILRLTLFKKYDLIHAHEHQTMPIGWFLAKVKRVKWIYDAHEHVPGNRRNFDTPKARWAISTEAFFLKRANVVITVGARLKTDLEKRGARDVIVIGNWKQLDKFAVADDILIHKHQEYRLNRFQLIVSYFGVLNEERQTDILVAAISKIPQVGLLIAGNGDFRQMTIDASEQYSNIIWLDWLPYQQVPLYTMLSDVIYICLKEVSGNPEYMAPNKLFDAFAAGKAMIARRGVGEIGQILEDENAAILLDDVTPKTVTDALKRLKDNPEILRSLKANAQAAGHKYNWETAERRLERLYADLLNR